jgi:hypothetical protein
MSYLLEGAVEHDRVMRARVIKDALLEARCLANILGGCSTPGVVPAILMLVTAVATVLLAMGLWRVGKIGFLVL